MKKIMTIALAAVVGVVANMAEAGACSPVVKDTAWVYKWKFTGKTTKGQATRAAVASSACAPKAEVCAIRVPSSLKIEGYTYACNPSACADNSMGFETAFVENNEVFWTTKPGKYSLAGGVATEIAHIIGRSAKQAEIAGVAKFDGDNMSYNFTYAGLGKYNKAQSRLTSASGNFAGFAKPCVCAKSAVWNCDTLTMCCDENLDTVVYGKWTVKYCANPSKKFITSGQLPKLPRWVQFKNQD